MKQKNENIAAKAGNTDLWKLLTIVPFIFALHEFEEWKILKWHQKYQSNIPDVRDIDLRTVFLFLIAVVFIISYIAMKQKNKKTGLYIIVPLLFFLIYNGLVHLYWSLYFSTYFPGLIFGFFVSVPLLGFILYKIISQNLVSKWYALILGVVITFMLINVISMGDKLEPAIVNAMLFGKTLADWIWF